jgi:hypothetical protein
MAAVAQPALPTWLAPFPGAVAGRVSPSPGSTEVSYTVGAPTDEVLKHYQGLFEGAHLAFVPNFDGLGYALRARATECDLLLKIREASGGASVRISCATKTAVPAAGTGIAVSNAPGTRPMPVPTMTPAQLRARVDAAGHSGADSMSRFDRPVDPKNAPAPPLEWERWLVPMTNPTGCGNPKAGAEYQQKFLECTYTTSAPMSKLYEFYMDRARANGCTVTTGHLGAGHTMTGVMQNSSAAVECFRATSSDLWSGPKVKVRIDLSRMYLNEPITVRMHVTVSGGR